MNSVSALSVVVLPEPVPPLMSTLQRARTALLRAGRAAAAAHVPLATRSSGPKPRGRKRRIVRTEPSSASGGDDDVDARAVGQPRVAQRLGLVDAAPERREDALDRVAQVGLAGEARRRRLDAPVALDPHLLGAVDHDLVDARGRASSGSSGPSPNERSAIARRQPRAGVVVEQARLAVDELADALVQVAAGVLGGLAQQPVAQRDRQLVERRVAIAVGPCPV